MMITQVLCVCAVGGPRGQGHSGQPPAVGHPRHRGGGRGARGQRRHRGEWRWRWGQRLSACVRAQPSPPSSLYPLMDLATHSLLTPLKPESSQWGAAKPQTLTESPGTVSTHRALLHLTFAKLWTVTWTPTPRNSLFYRDLFIHFPLLAEENSVNTNRPVVCVCVCLWEGVRASASMVCNLVSLYRYGKWTHCGLEDLLLEF